MRREAGGVEVAWAEQGYGRTEIALPTGSPNGPPSSQAQGRDGDRLGKRGRVEDGPAIVTGRADAKRASVGGLLDGELDYLRWGVRAQAQVYEVGTVLRRKAIDRVGNVGVARPAIGPVKTLAVSRSHPGAIPA